MFKWRKPLNAVASKAIAEIARPWPKSGKKEISDKLIDGIDVMGFTIT